MPETMPADYRAALRQRLIARRQALDPHDCAALSATIRNELRHHFPQLAALRVAFCWPIRNEPDLLPLMREWIENGRDEFVALLPVVINTDAALAFRAWTPDSELLADRYGIPTPASGPFLVPQALLLPVNAFDADGYRLGYGGGFFDRTLAALGPATLRIGVGFELARVDSIHPEPHDVRLDAMVSEAGVFHSR